MHRRDFIVKGSFATIFSERVISSAEWLLGQGLQRKVNIHQMPPVAHSVSNNFLSVVKWMQETAWSNVLKKISNISSLDVSNPLHAQYFETLNLSPGAWEGCDDFAGNKLIEPGDPARSLLYHILASPRVLLPSDASAESYPSLESIDMLENFIYALSPVSFDETEENKLTLAMFAYEYRPACKTPSEKHADLVFSRTGFARIGTRPMANYDRKNRCFMNLPDNAHEKEIAVTPARYALFLARVVPYTEVVRNTAINLDVKNNLDFLLPLRKIFKDDIYLRGHDLTFSESHINEKLRKLCITKTLKLPSSVSFDLSKAPFTRVSSSSTKPGEPFQNKYDKGMVMLTPVESSVLLSSVPAPLAQRAFQEVNGKQERLRVEIPPEKSEGLLYKYSNRRYTSLKILGTKKGRKDVFDIGKARLFWPNRVITDYNAHRNAPMFVNIREVVSEKTGNIINYLSPTYPNIQQEIDKSYWTGLFEDNICDGCIFPEIMATGAPLSSDEKYSVISQKLLALPRLPAFSIVAAPDFFPLVESYDMKAYKELFFNGGLEDMSGARKRANPNITLPGSKEFAFPQKGSDLEEEIEMTVVALISKPATGNGNADPVQLTEQGNKLTRTNFLPDSATKIFYPGWDATYSGGVDEEGRQQGTFYATFGLGSPFVEDAKLCAAANGMWAAASPDSARTFRGSLSSSFFVHQAPTAVPLLDDELGYHNGSPAVQDYQQDESTGWDGEEGPFVYKEDDNILINFTDIGRADYVQNALNNKFDMSRLRRITTMEIKARMDALQLCFKKLRLKNTDLWLIGAEKVENWQSGAAGYCLSKSIFGNDNAWVTKGRDSNWTNGYIYLFANIAGSPVPLFDSKRMQQPCKELYIFQVSKGNIACCKMSKQKNWQPQWT